MNDKFLHDLRRDPPPALVSDLRERLRRQDAAAPRVAPRATLRFAIAAALVVVATGALFVFPAVRASAQAFLDLFRVRNFTAVTVSPERLQQLKDGKIDLQSVVGGHVETLQQPDPPRVLLSAAEAAPLLGYVPRTPATLPGALRADTVLLSNEGVARITLDLTKLHGVLEALDIRDVRVPDELNGATMTIHMPMALRQNFVSDHHRVVLLQAHSPEVELPAGADLAQFGEIALRIAGLEASEAHRLAQSIDWRTTMVVPVPANVGAFRDVDVRGHRGLMVSLVGDDARTPGGRHREGATVMWTDGDMVFALSGNLSNVELLEMANALP
jgi:hypothetical protein